MAGVTVDVDDLLPVRSRVSWSAVLAGAVIALAVHFLLLLLGTAIGLSVADQASRDTITTAGGIWAIASTMIALFLGGWVTSQAAVGENRADAAVHGIIMWGVVFAMLLWLIAMGISGGFNAMVGVATATNADETGWQAAAVRAGVPQQQIDQWQSAATNNQTDPATAERANDAAKEAAWWTLVATILSMLAAILGAIVGAGGKYHVLAVGLARGETRSTVATGQRAPSPH